MNELVLSQAPAGADRVDDGWGVDGLPDPREPAYLDRLEYQAVHFYGRRLCDALTESARYLESLERAVGRQPHVLCIYHEGSIEDTGTELAWRLTVVVSGQ